MVIIQALETKDAGEPYRGNLFVRFDEGLGGSRWLPLGYSTGLIKFSRACLPFGLRATAVCVLRVKIIAGARKPRQQSVLTAIIKRFAVSTI